MFRGEQLESRRANENRQMNEDVPCQGGGLNDADQASWDALRRRLLACLKRSGAAQDVEDACQEAMLRILRVRSSQAIRDSFAFCLVVARAKLVDARRRMGVAAKSLHLHQELVAPQDLAWAQDLRPLFLDIMIGAGLARCDAELLAGVRIDGLSWQSAAVQVALAPADLAAAKRRIQRFLSLPASVERLAVLTERATGHGPRASTRRMTT